MICVTFLAAFCIQELRWWLSVRKIRMECGIQIMEQIRMDFRTDCCCGRKLFKTCCGRKDCKTNARLQLEKEQAVKDSRTCIVCRNEEKTCVVTACWHLFCVNCCWRMHMNGNKCAVCRSEMCGWTPIYWTD